MADCLPDRDGAVREVAQVYELIKTHQHLLLVHADERAAPSLSTTTLLAQNLLNEALRALNVALSVLKQQQPSACASAAAPASIKAEPRILLSSSPAANSSGSPAPGDCKQLRRAGKRRRRAEEDKYSWVNMTAVPHEDGYQWRKYGEKKIHGTHFAKSYFRCTYKDDKGCQATKQIQQKDSSDPPMFQVTYSNEHTCTVCTTATGAAASSSNLASLLGYDCNTAAGINDPNARPADQHAGSRMVEQEPRAAPPPLAAQVASDLGQTQTPWQEAFPVSNTHCGPSPYNGIASAASTGSCSNASALSRVDELDQITVMDHEPALGLGDDASFYHDPHLLLLYDSFKYY